MQKVISSIAPDIFRKRFVLYLLLFRCLNILLIVSPWVISANPVYGSGNQGSLFLSDDLLEITLKVDFSALINDVGKNRRYHQCQICYIGQDGQEVLLNSMVKTRGKFRLDPQNCDFPPLKFNFSSKETAGTIFEDQDKLKLVSHCQNYIDAYEQHVLEEFLIYRIYNLISKYSYRVRLARITYLGDADSLTRFGFFLEDRDQMAQRCNRSILNYKNINQYSVVRESMIMLSLFQLMIGNSDWAVDRLHNIDLISMDEYSLPVAVPYDFDWAAIIGYPYHVPDPRIAPNGKYQRVYKGYRWSKEEFDQAFEKYRQIKDSVINLIAQFPYLTDDNKKKCIDYISEFYQIINSRKDVRDMLIKNSRKIPR